MNTPKLPPLPEALDEAIKEFARASMAYDPSRWTAANQQLKKAIEAYALAAIAAQGVPDGWQPIKTAPKDGTTLLLATQRGRIADGAWHQKYGVWGWPYVMVEPTHWMPLPATTNASAPPAPQAAVVQQEPPQPPGFTAGWPWPDFAVQHEQPADHLPDVKKMIEAKPLSDEHVTDGSKCWCDPELVYKDPYTMAEVWVHRGKQ